MVAKPDPAGSFGFALSTLANGTHIVHHVTLPDTVLEVDDELDMINNEIAAKFSHDEVILLLSKSSALSLSLTRINEHYVDVVLEKKDGSFGVSLGSQVGPLLGNFDIVSRLQFPRLPALHRPTHGPTHEPRDMAPGLGFRPKIGCRDADRCLRSDHEFQMQTAKSLFPSGEHTQIPL